MEVALQLIRRLADRPCQKAPFHYRGSPCERDGQAEPSERCDNCNARATLAVIERIGFGGAR